MKRKIVSKSLTAAVFLLSCFVSTSTLAASVEIDWHEPDSYRDIDESKVETKTKFRQSVFKQLGSEFEKHAAKLPDNYVLKIKVTDLDLAGDASPATAAGMHGTRVFKDIYPPRIWFTYKLEIKDNVTLLQGQERLQDMSYLQRGTLRSNSDRFHYDKRLIKSWFDRILLPAYEASK